MIGTTSDGIRPLRIAFDSPDSLAIRPVRLRPVQGARHRVDLPSGWRFDIARLGKGSWCVLSYLVAPWRPTWKWDARAAFFTSTMKDAVVGIRRILDEPGMDPQAVLELTQREMSQACAAWTDEQDPRRAFWASQMRRLEFALGVETLSDPARDVAIRLLDSFVGTPADLVAAARTITA